MAMAMVTLSYRIQEPKIHRSATLLLRSFTDLLRVSHQVPTKAFNAWLLDGKIYVQQARGSDPHKYHEHTPRPTGLMQPHDVDFRDNANEALKQIFYKGAEKIGQY